MSGCLEGYNAIASHLLTGIHDHNILKELENESSTQTNAPSESNPWIFHSTTIPTPIITMQNGKFSATAAMAINEGNVTAVGTYEDVKAAAGPDAQDRDLKDQCIVPGFVEPHLHILLSALLKGFYFDCDPLNKAIQGCFKNAIAHIKSEAQNLEKDQWLLGFGFDPSRLTLGNDGKFQDLTLKVFNDNNLNENPIFIMNASGHLAYANQRAFDIAGVNEHSKAPKGSQYVKVDGKLTGILQEPGAYRAFLSKTALGDIKKIPKILDAIRGVFKEWSAKGFTTVFDAGIGQINGVVEVPILYELSKSAPLRVTGAAANMNSDDALQVVGFHKKMPEGGATLLKIKTIKLWMDGSTQGFTAALEESYNKDILPQYVLDENAENGWARWKVSPTCLIDTGDAPCITHEMQKWAAKGYQLMVHVNGDCAAQVVLDAFKQLAERASPNSAMMHRLEHFTVTTEDQVIQAKKLNLGVSHTIGHVKYWGSAFSKHILLEPRADRIDPVGDDVTYELVYSFHSDSPVSQADALSYVSTAVTRLMYNSTSVLGEGQRVTVEAALAGVTINPAKQILLDSEIGSLEKGKNADFVILSQDISSPTVDPSKIDSTWVKETWFQGVPRHILRDTTA